MYHNYHDRCDGKDEERIKVYRALHDLTQEALAERLAVTRQTILAIEKGKCDPSLELAFRHLRNSLVYPVEKVFIRGSQCEDQPLV
ncbi:MAG: helix-turn-helix transcriptional regulator [Desulfosudis oleivorans]|nr:helix-turn-helix transcriptional regulator [Desulfosudis oleivorans]